MADVNAPALPVIAAVPPRNSSTQAPAQAAGQPDQTEQPSFAQVLKSRSAGSQQQADKPAQNAKSGQVEAKQTADGKAAAERSETETSVRSGEASDLLIIAGEHSEQALADEDAALFTETSAQNLNSPITIAPAQDPASLAAALAAGAATLAAKAADQGGNSTLKGDDSALTEQALSELSEQTASLQDKREQNARSQSQSATDALALNTRQPPAQETAAAQERSQNFSSELALAQSTAASNAQSTQNLAQASVQNGRLDTALPRHEVNTPVATRGWAEDVGQKLTWISTRDSGRAELVLNPPQMGRVEVSINLQGDQASAVFSAANPIAREALQDALPRLREVFAQAGIQLGQANVNAGNNGQAQGQNQAARSHANGRYANSDAAALEPLVSAGHASWSRSGSGMVDTFA